MSKHLSLNPLTEQLLGQNLIGAEIGVFKGNTSFGLLNSSHIRHLYMIDPWKSGYSIKNSRKTDSSDRDQEWMDATYARIAKKCQNNPKATLIRKSSLDAANEVPDELDFVFIDGNHAYKAVYNDLISWVPKVRKGGIVAGDDWSTGWKTVIKAVTQYINEHDPFLPPCKSPVKGRPVPYDAPIINRTWQTVWWGIKKN